jgi:hypothetical protein
MTLNCARKAAPGRAVTPALLSGLVLLFPIVALSHPGTLAVSPPMGWNSWDAYGFTLDETAFRNNATVLGKYRRYGWRYAIIDEGRYMANPLGTDRQSRDWCPAFRTLRFAVINAFHWLPMKKRPWSLSSRGGI